MRSDMAGTSGRLLVVDDEEALRRALVRTLSGAGYEVLEAANGARAMELVTAERFDVIVSDLSMPEMDGMTLLMAVRQVDFDVPVVLMTGLPDVATAMQAIEFGAFQYLAKPIETKRFLEVIGKAAQLHRMALMKREALALLGAHQGQASDRAGLEASLDRALAGLWMAFQPIVRVSDRSLYGYEALLRTTEKSLPHPGAVIEAAEKLDRLHSLGRSVRRSAVAPFVGDESRGFLFVNLHTRDLADETLFASALDGSPLTGIAPRVVLEITERAALDEVRDARSRVARLRTLGFRIAIDDLGAGYAGLTSFAHLEPEIVKLDMSLVRDIHRTPTKQKLVRSMTTLCKDMGMLVVGEGVETEAERDTLVELGCDLLQGYLFAKPGPAFPTFAW